MLVKSRRYTNGSWLASHLDTVQWTGSPPHVILAILNIGQVQQEQHKLYAPNLSLQAVEEDWPLYILDNDGAVHSVVLHPGEMLWYESARAVHGRPTQFNGEYFDNLFIHFRLVSKKEVQPTEFIRDYQS
jgi:hypothetical protein